MEMECTSAAAAGQPEDPGCQATCALTLLLLPLTRLTSPFGLVTCKPRTSVRSSMSGQSKNVPFVACFLVRQVCRRGGTGDDDERHARDTQSAWHAIALRTHVLQAPVVPLQLCTRCRDCIAPVCSNASYELLRGTIEDRIPHDLRGRIKVLSQMLPNEFNGSRGSQGRVVVVASCLMGIETLTTGHLHLNPTSCLLSQCLQSRYVLDQAN